MTDAQHIQEKEALEDQTNRLLVVDGVNLGTVTFTEVGMWTVTNDGKITGPDYTIAFTPSSDCQAAIELLKASEAPVEPPPTEEPPPDEEPPPVEEPPPTNDNTTHEVVATLTDADGKQWSAKATVGNDPTVAGIYQKLVGTDGSEHPGLTATFYADGCEVNARRADNAYDWLGFKAPTITYDGQAVPVPASSNTDGTYDFWRGCAMPTIRYGKQVGWDASKIDWSILPSYMKTPQELYGDSKRDYSFNGLGISTMSGMSSTGERPDIGYLPTWDVGFITSPSDETWGVVRRAADHDGVWPVFFCEPDTGHILDVETYPDANLLPKAQRSTAWKNPIVVYGGSYRGSVLTAPKDGWGISKCPNVPNGAHLTGFAMLAAMITGTARDKDHASFWGNYPLMEINPAYRKSGGVMLGAQRRAAWCLRSVFMAGYVSSDQDYFKRRTDRQIEVANAIPKNSLGLLDTNTAYKGTGSALGCSGLALWQVHYLMEVMDAVAYKLDSAKPFAQYLGSWYANFQSSPYAPLMTIYFWVVHDPQGNLITDVLQQARYSLISNGWSDDDAASVTKAGMNNEDVYNAIVTRYKNKGSAFAGKFVNGVCDFLGAITASDSYPAGAIAATIAAHNVGTPNCDAALQRVLNLPTKPNYSKNGKYWLTPRA